jgi:hypothetical protein
MHTEHLQNVRPVRVLAGWLVAIAVVSIVVFGFILVGLMGESGPADTVWTMTAVAAGFMVGGWFIGYGTLEAPILHGIALGLTSLLAWVVVNAVVVVGFRGVEWEGLTATAALSVILTQMIAGVVGCWVGVRGARLRAVELSGPGAGVRGRDEEGSD